MLEELRSYAFPNDGGRDSTRAPVPDLRAERFDPEDVDLEHREGLEEGSAEERIIGLPMPRSISRAVAVIEDVVKHLETFNEQNIHAIRHMGFHDAAMSYGEVRPLADACRAGARFFGELFEARHEDPVLAALGPLTDAVEANLEMYLLQFSQEEIEQGVSLDRLGAVVRISIVLKQQLRGAARQLESGAMGVMMQIAAAEQSEAA